MTREGLKVVIPARLRSYLDENGIDYRILYHQRVYTAQEVAAAQHVPGRELVKVVMVRVDSELMMMVLPASFIVDMDTLKRLFPAKNVIGPGGGVSGPFPGLRNRGNASLWQSI